MAKEIKQFDPSGQQELPAADLQKACENLKTLINSESAKESKNKFFQSGFLPVDQLSALFEQTKSGYVKVYAALLDDGTPFVFLAPINEFGEALEGEKTVVQFCVPPRVPPCDEAVYDSFLKP